MSDVNEPHNVVVKREWHCPQCETVFHLVRAEPFCEFDHPGQYHLEGMQWGLQPCESCESWREPFDHFMMLTATSPRTDAVMLFPPQAGAPSTLPRGSNEASSN